MSDLLHFLSAHLSLHLTSWVSLLCNIEAGRIAVHLIVTKACLSRTAESVLVDKSMSSYKSKNGNEQVFNFSDPTWKRLSLRL